MIVLVLALLAQAPMPEKAALEGTAVSATTGVPLKKVAITLEGDKDPTATTTSDGKFSFTNIPPGDYTIKAERVGYLESPETVVTLQPGEVKKDFVVKLTPQAVISGRVLDEDGDPVPGSRVAYIRWIGAGEKKFKLESDLTDANGEGGFTITGLSPGNYYLQASEERVQRERQTGEDFVPTYYPNAVELAGASALLVPPGGEIRNLVINLRKAPTFRVRGKVAIPAGAAGVPTSLDLIPADSNEMSLFYGGHSASIVKGEFEFTAVPAGSYTLRSDTNVLTRTEDGEFSFGFAHFFFRQPVEVSDRDIDDLAVSFTPGIDVTGTFHTGGLKLSKPLSVILSPEFFVSRREPKAQADDTGAFHIAQLPPDRLAIEISNLPDDAYIKSIRYGEQEVKGSLDLTSPTSASLEITLAPNAAEIAGTLHDAKGDPVPDGVVTLWTSDDAPQKFAQTASDGSFTVKNLAPGDYFLAAWDNVDMDPPELRKLYECQAVKVTVHEGSREKADVKLIVVHD